MQSVLNNFVGENILIRYNQIGGQSCSETSPYKVREYSPDEDIKVILNRP